MNDYFNAPNSPQDFTLARASGVRALFAAIAGAFDLLPARDALLTGRVNYAAAGGTADAIAITLDPGPEAYLEGQSFRVKLAATNTGAATLNVNGLGAVAVVKSDGSALAAGNLLAGAIQDFTYDGTSFRLPATGPQGPQGIQGPSGGVDGKSVLNGTVDPSNGVGNNGDFYINTTAKTLFGPKAAGAWPAGVSLVGPAGINGTNGTNGTNGNTILYGAGAPAGGTGVNGDFYIKTTAPWTIYGPKAAGAWPGGVSLVGPAGADGAVDTSDLALTGVSTTQPGASAYEIGFRDLPISRSVAVNFTLDPTDRGCGIVYTDTGDACTVPLNSAVAIGNGSIITIVNNGTGPLTITRGTDGSTTVAMKLAGNGNDANRTLAVGGVCWLWKIATNTWFIGGTGVS